MTDIERIVELVNKVSQEAINKSVAKIVDDKIVLFYKDMKEVISTKGFSVDYLANRISTSKIGRIIF